jgi:hypothetical protein
MKYVKLTVTDDEWYKLGTEVWKYDEDKRFTVDEWDQQLQHNGLGVLVCGVATRKGYEPEWMTFVNDCRIDGELCHEDEFFVEIVDNDGSEEIKQIIKQYS